MTIDRASSRILLCPPHSHPVLRFLMRMPHPSTYGSCVFFSCLCIHKQEKEWDTAMSENLIGTSSESSRVVQCRFFLSEVRPLRHPGGDPPGIIRGSPCGIPPQGIAEGSLGVPSGWFFVYPRASRWFMASCWADLRGSGGVGGFGSWVLFYNRP